MTSELIRNRGPEKEPKIATRNIITEVAKHSGVTYDVASDVVYSFLHYVKYAALATEQKILVRNFGTFYLSKTKGRMYGKHVDAAKYVPDRMKLGLTSDLMEVDTWKNMQSIQQSVTSALDAELKPHSMDLSVCARIAALVLSSKPLNEMDKEGRVKLARDWIYSIGASPLLPAVTKREDPYDNEYHTLKYRLKGQQLRIILFDPVPDSLYLSASVRARRDLVFLPQGWVSAKDIRPGQSEVPPEIVHPYGDSLEEQCRSLYEAFKEAKYG